MGGSSSKEDFDDGSDVESGSGETLTAEEEIKRVLRRAVPLKPNRPSNPQTKPKCLRCLNSGNASITTCNVASRDRLLPHLSR